MKSPAELLAASGANMIAFWSAYGRGAGCTLQVAPGVVWVYTGIPTPLFNCVLLSDAGAADVQATADAVRAKIDARGVPAMWWVGPQAGQDDVAPRLERIGLAPTGEVPGMALDLALLDDAHEALPGFTVERVQGTVMQALWGHTAGIGTGFPDEASAALAQVEATLHDPEYLAQRRYIGYLDGQPVATSALVLAGGVAGIYAVATMPAARRRGIGRLMTVLPLLEARREGYRSGILQSSAVGYPVYKALGFEEVSRYRLYAQA